MNPDLVPLTFAFLIAPGSLEQQGLLLARSIRTFGGGLAQQPIWAALPEMGKVLADETREALDELDVALVPFNLEESALRFPFAAKVYAAAAVEEKVAGETAVLAWMDTDALVLQEPNPLLLPAGKTLGYRPVDHANIGSPFTEPPNAFWQAVYDRCGVAASQLCPMVTSVDEVQLRPYFNAGLLAVRPERSLLQKWRETFDALYEHPDFTPFYEQDFLYRIFIHQAVLAGVLLYHMPPSEMLLLPYLVNYPLHMHREYPANRRPARVNDLITTRYDLLADKLEQLTALPMDESLKSWLTTHWHPS